MPYIFSVEKTEGRYRCTKSGCSALLVLNGTSVKSVKFKRPYRSQTDDIIIFPPAIHPFSHLSLKSSIHSSLYQSLSILIPSAPHVDSLVCRAVDPFFRIGGGGGGGKCKKNVKKFRRKVINFARILALHIIIFFKLSKLLGGGKRYVCPPNILIGGRCPPALPGSTPLLV